MSYDVLTSPLQECLSLLNSASFDLRGNVFLSGKQTGATILLTTPSDDPSELMIQIVCHASGHLCLDWDGLGILLDDSVSGDMWVSFLDAHGRARFRIPKPSEASFHLATSMSLEVVFAGQLVGDAMDGGLQPLDDQDLSACEATSTDGQITAFARRDPSGVVTVHVKTHERRLRNATAYVDFRSPNGTVFEQGNMLLDLEERDENGELVYWGEWMKETVLPVDAVMRVVAFPRPPGSGDSSH